MFDGAKVLIPAVLVIDILRQKCRILIDVGHRLSTMYTAKQILTVSHQALCHSCRGKEEGEVFLFCVGSCSMGLKSLS